MLYVIGLEDGKDIRSIEVEAPIAASVAIADGVGYGRYGSFSDCF